MTAAAKPINTIRFAERLRTRAIDVPNRRLLISRIVGSEQESDLTVAANCNGFGRIRHFKERSANGWPINPLPIIPACRALNIAPPPEMMTALVFQNAACAWRCWYCFVPDELLIADPRRSAWFTAEELVEMYIQVSDRPVIIDLSGGSPDLVPEWIVWMMDALTHSGLTKSTFLWSDDNLSTTYLFDHLDASTISQLERYRNYGRVCCIKGFDARSFAFNTRAAPGDFDRQFEILRRVLTLGIDVYGYVTLTSPFSDNVSSGVASLIDRLQDIDANFPLRVVPLRIQIFTPVEHRLAKREDRERSLLIQEEAIASWNDEISRRFNDESRALQICDVPRSTRTC
jgi:uncharacterized Fe-S cluster-containing radical SAM superfamily protein